MFAAYDRPSRGTRGDADIGFNSPTSEAPLRVLVTGRSPMHFVKYVDQFIGDNSAGGEPDGIEFEYRKQLTGVLDVDVVHLTATSDAIGDHRTPERERIRRARRFARSLRRRRIALVRTVQGEEAGSERIPSRAETLLDRATTAYVAMRPATAAQGGRPTTVIPHSHLRDRFLGYPRADRVRGRLLFVSAGTLRRAYEAPLKVFAAAELPGWALRIVGKVPSALEDSFARTLSRHPTTISLCDDALSDAARIIEITQAELVIAAAPESDETLSIIMLALSLDRPVLVESTASTRLLADEVGHDWIRLHEGPLTAATLEAAVSRLREESPSGRPNLDARDPNTIAGRYKAVYHAAAASR